MAMNYGTNDTGHHRNHPHYSKFKVYTNFIYCIGYKVELKIQDGHMELQSDMTYFSRSSIMLFLLRKCVEWIF